MQDLVLVGVSTHDSKFIMEDNESILVQTHTIKPTSILSKANLYGKEMIESKINEFDASIGYPSELEFPIISNYLGKMMELYAALTYQYKLENSSELTDMKGLSIKTAFQKVFLNNDGTASSFVNVMVPESKIIVNEKTGESNALWARRLSKTVELVRLPASVMSAIAYLYGGYFSATQVADDGHRFLHSIRPVTPKSVRDYYDDLLIEIQSIINSNKFLLTFAEMLGFIPLLQGADYTRDLYGNTISVVPDEYLFEAIETDWSIFKRIFRNSTVTFNEERDSIKFLQNSVMQYTPDQVYMDFINYTDVVTFAGGQQFYSLIINHWSQTETGLDYGLIAVAIDGREVLVGTTSLATNSIAFEVVGNISTADITKLSNAISRWSWSVLNENIKFPFNVGVHYVLVNDGEAESYVDIRNNGGSAGFNESYNLFAINKGDFIAVGQDLIAASVYGKEYTHGVYTNKVTRITK